MKNNILLSLFIMMYLPAFLLHAESPAAKSGDNTVTWQEGKNKWKLRILTDEIAEIPGEDDAAEKSRGLADQNARLVSSKNRVRIWKVTDEWNKTYFPKGRISPGIKGTYSPVFLDNSGRKRVPAGNIIVFMKKDMSENDVNIWADGKNLKVIKCLSKYSNSYLINTPPGIESLNISNELYNDENVILSTPNWWSEVAPR